jgi:hypothetical protein
MRSSILYISSVVIVLLVGIAALSDNRSGTPQNPSLQILNRTRAFSVIKAESGPNEFSITLKNNSTKAVTAFSISLGNGFSIVEEFVFAEVSNIGIGPGALFSKSYSTLTSIQPQAIEIKALIFDDGTAEGDTFAVRQIEDSRLGQQIQMRRAVKELQTFLAKGPGDVSEFKTNLSNALNSSDDDTLNVLAELKPSHRITKQSLSADLREGLDNGRQNVLRRLGEAETARSNHGLLELKEIYERILERCP